MQKQKCVISFLMLVLGFILLYSCEKVTLKEPPLPPPGPGVDSIRFSADIKPIFSVCAGCHGGSISPNLKDTPYQSLKDGNFFDTDQPSQSKLYVQLTTKSSHIGKTSPIQNTKILQWITQGAKNN